MMSDAHLTSIVIIAVAFALGGYDIVMAMRDPDQKSTISVVLRHAPKIVIFALGMLMGHIYWR